MSRVVGLDVGGANLKLAAVDGRATSLAFPLWRAADRLAETLVGELQRFAPIDAVAVTMTGELADCFADRAEGVRRIVGDVQRAAGSLGVRQLGYYGVDGRFHDADEAVRLVDAIAAANWHALAKQVASELLSDGWLVDVGSTTTDLIPMVGGEVATSAKTDFDRLCEGSLVYVGCRRTPVCALVDRLSFQGREATVMNELFATIDDARLVLGQQVSLEADCDTADGRPRTPRHAADRLARMIGLDRRQVDVEAARGLAEQVVAEAQRRMAEGFARLRAGGTGPGLGAGWVLSGHGTDLVDVSAIDPQAFASVDECGGEICRPPVIELGERWGREVARSAPAYAVAARWLAQA